MKSKQIWCTFGVKNEGRNCILILCHRLYQMQSLFFCATEMRECVDDDARSQWFFRFRLLLFPVAVWIFVALFSIVLNSCLCLFNPLWLRNYALLMNVSCLMVTLTHWNRVGKFCDNIALNKSKWPWEWEKWFAREREIGGLPFKPRASMDLQLRSVVLLGCNSCDDFINRSD